MAVLHLLIYEAKMTCSALWEKKKKNRNFIGRSGFSFFKRQRHHLQINKYEDEENIWDAMLH